MLNTILSFLAIPVNLHVRLPINTKAFLKVSTLISHDFGATEIQLQEVGAILNPGLRSLSLYVGIGILSIELGYHRSFC